MLNIVFTQLGRLKDATNLKAVGLASNGVLDEDFPEECFDTLRAGFGPKVNFDEINFEPDYC